MEQNQVSHQNLASHVLRHINRYHLRQALTRETFLSSMFNFLRRRINNREDCSVIVREARNQFRLQRFRKPFDQLFSDVIFSIFEIIGCNEQPIIIEELNNFVMQKLTTRSVEQEGLPWTQLINWLDAFNYRMSNSYTTCLILNLEASRRILRFGVEIQLNVLHMYQMFRKLQSILPLIFDQDEDELELSLEAIHRVYTTPNSKIRLCVLMLVLYVTLQMQEPDLFPKCKDSLESIKLVFRTIRQPFVTAEEVIRFFSVSTGVNDNDSRVRDTVKKFIEYFPKSSGFVAPRSLKHLARCEVRKQMGRAGSLPNGVWGLQMPVNLQNYLLIQNSKEEHYPAFVAALSSRKRPLPQNSVVERVCP